MVKKLGFSLIELTVVIGLLSLLILAISSTMLMSIVSSNRIRTVTKVKQAGNYALGQLQSMIRSAKSITSCISSANSSTPSITLINQDGGSTLIITDLDADATYRIASISATSSPTLTPANIDVQDFSITCEPSDIEPSLIKLSFNLKDLREGRATESPILKFETSVNLRNE